jgi:hypothetical protein
MDAAAAAVIVPPGLPLEWPSFPAQVGSDAALAKVVLRREAAPTCFSVKHSEAQTTTTWSRRLAWRQGARPWHTP